MKVYRANNKKAKNSALTVCLLLTVMLAIGGTLAYLFTSTAPVENTFNPAKVGNYVSESFDGTTKTDVKIQNAIRVDDSNVSIDGIVDAYIRATYVVTWQKTETDENDNEIKYMLPANAGDYTVVINLNNTADGTAGKWVLHSDGYYYYTGVVAPGAYTDVFISSIAPVEGKSPAGYKLHVEILSQSIQAEGTDIEGKTPAQLKWHVTISESGVTAYTAS